MLLPPTPTPDTCSEVTTTFMCSFWSKYKKHTTDLLWIVLLNVLSCTLEIYIKVVMWKGILDKQQTKTKKIHVTAINHFWRKDIWSHWWQLWIMVSTLDLEEFYFFSSTMWQFLAYSCLRLSRQSHLVPSLNLFLLFTFCPEAWNKTLYLLGLENGSWQHDPTSWGIVICKVTHQVQHWKQKLWNHLWESFLLKMTSTFSEMTPIPIYWQKGIMGHWSVAKPNWWSEWLSRSPPDWQKCDDWIIYFFMYFLSYTWKVCKTTEKCKTEMK